MRRSRTKLQILERRHPGLGDMVETMFAEFWPIRDVKQLVAEQCGESLSLATVERYKRKHWQAQRELVEEMSELIASSDHRAIGSSADQALDDQEFAIAELSVHPLIGPSHDLAIWPSGHRSVGRAKALSPHRCIAKPFNGPMSRCTDEAISRSESVSR
jgi:hypothetical protein